MPANQINARNERALKRQIDLYLRELEQNGNNLLAQHYDAANQLMQEAQPIINGPQPQERPAKRQRIISTLQNVATSATLTTGFIAGAYLAGCAAGYPHLSGPLLLLSGLGLKLRANIQNSCSQEAEQIQNDNKKRRRDSDGSPQGIR